MNCDQAFDHLTDPELCDSAALRRHLEKCPRCREMRETLAPALDFLLDGVSRDGRDEASPGESFGLTASDNARAQFLSPEAVDVAEQAARQLIMSRRVPDSAGRRRETWILRVAAMVLVGGVTAFGIFGIKQETPASACTRDEAARPSSANSKDAATIVRSCVACHLPQGKS